MEVRDAVHPEQARSFNTEELRKHFLITGLFVPDTVKLVYSYYDRLIVGGILPVKPQTLNVDKKIIGASYLLERREMGIINVGAPGTVTVDGQSLQLNAHDGLYVGMGARELLFSSLSPDQPARFYLNCAPAHKTYPTTKMTINEAAPAHLGSPEKGNKRTIYKYIHPDGIRSCQLVMGMTHLEPCNLWNTMPVHTHQRRMEAYFYFNMGTEDLVFQFIGAPSETRHLIVHNEEAVLHPSWSIHSGVGTKHYSFIWGMAGENQTFSDMDEVPMSDLR